MKRDQNTYGKVSRKFDEFTEIVAARPAPEPRGLPPQRPYVPEPIDHGMAKNIPAIIGFGIAAVLFVLAILAFATAAKWSDLGRDGAMVGYTMVGIFLTIASLGGAASVWNHNFRVLTRTSPSHH